MPATNTSVARARKPTGRVTPPKPRAPRASGKVDPEYDVDQAWADAGVTPISAYDFDQIPTTNIAAFGEVFRVLQAINLMKILEDPDEGKSIKFVFDLIHPDDLDRFKAAYGRQLNISADAVNELITRMVKAASAGNPSTPSSDSGGTAHRRASRQLSAGS